MSIAGIQPGHVRLVSGWATSSLRAECWTGMAWVPLRGVVAVSWSCDKRETTANAKMTVIPVSVEVMTPADRVAWQTLADAGGNGPPQGGI